MTRPSVEEAADVLEVIHAIAALNNVDLARLEDVRKQKASGRGAFDKRIILEQTKSSA